jgi:hypothetical protein
MTGRTTIARFLLGSTLLLSVAAFQAFAVENSSPPIVPPVGDRSAVFPLDSLQTADTATLDLSASATLTAAQATQPENIFLFSFPLPPGQQSFLGLNGEVSLISALPVFNESLNSVAVNTSGPCPADGSVFPNYTAVYAAYPNLAALQSFILKNPDRGTSKVAIDYRMPVGLPVSNCMVIMLDWEGGSRVNMTSTLKMIYTAESSSPAGMLLQTNQEFVFGIYIGPGSTRNDSLSFVQETRITQPGTLLAFVGDISDSTFGIPAPPGLWRTSNDIYLVPGSCPSDIPVISGGWTPMGGDYYSDLPPDAQHLLSVPLLGFQKMAAQKFIYQPLDVKVEPGDCLLTMFGLSAPKGGINSENQVKAVFVPAQ